MPSTDCRYWVAKMANPTTANMDTRFSATAPVKPRLRNSLRSIIGSPLRAWRTRKHAPTRTPATIAPIRSGLAPLAAISCMP